jgi:UDP-N-acetyl-D-glucosamine dehydrogenase
MPYNVVEAIANALNERQKAIKGSRILVLGVAYKKDVDDLRESPTLKIMQLLLERGARVEYNDPYFPQLHKMRHYDYSQMRSVDLTAGNLAAVDCVVIATDHSSYDYQAIVEAAPLVVDTRNATRRIARNRNKIVLC